MRTALRLAAALAISSTASSCSIFDGQADKGASTDPQGSDPRATSDPVGLVVSSFAGRGAVGAKVANTLGLQISRTFPEGDGSTADEEFRQGLLIWDDAVLSEPNHGAAFTTALNNGTPADLLLWGSTYEIGDGVVVQAYLTVSPSAARHNPASEIWKIEVPIAQGSSVTVEAGLPEQHYSFEPVVLPHALIEQYSGIDHLPVYQDKSFSTQVGVVKPGFRAIEYTDDAVLLQSAEISGWVPLPPISEDSSEVVEFSGALVRVLLSDWRGAEPLLTSVLAHDALPQSLRTDTLLLQGLMREKQGESGRDWMETAYELNPFQQQSAKFVVMSRLAELVRPSGRSLSAEERATEVADIAGLVDSTRFLFATDDPWLSSVDTALAALAESTVPEAGGRPEPRRSGKESGHDDREIGTSLPPVTPPDRNGPQNGGGPSVPGNGGGTSDGGNGGGTSDGGNGGGTSDGGNGGGTSDGGNVGGPSDDNSISP